MSEVGVYKSSPASRLLFTASRAARAACQDCHRDRSSVWPEAALISPSPRGEIALNFSKIPFQPFECGLIPRVGGKKVDGRIGNEFRDCSGIGFGLFASSCSTLCSRVGQCIKK